MNIYGEKLLFTQNAAQQKRIALLELQAQVTLDLLLYSLFSKLELNFFEFCMNLTSFYLLK